MALFSPELYPLNISPLSQIKDVDLETPLRGIGDLVQKNFIRDELEMRSVKILDIGYIAVLYFSIGIAVAVFFDKIFGIWTLERDSRKSSFRLGIELIGIIWLFGATTYIVRNLIERIPSPMSYIPLSNPERKFEHRKVKELASATVFTLILMRTSHYFKNKLEYFYQRITGRLNE